MQPLLVTSFDSLGMDIIALSNAEGNKIIVAEAGGALLKTSPHVLVDKATLISLD